MIDRVASEASVFIDAGLMHRKKMRELIEACAFVTSGVRWIEKKYFLWSRFRIIGPSDDLKEIHELLINRVESDQALSRWLEKN